MSKGGKTVETRQDTSPWTAQQPYLKDLFTRAQDLYQANPSGTNPQIDTMRQAIYNRAQQGSPLTDAAKAETLKTLQGGYSNPYAAGALGDAMDMARAKVNAQFTGDNSGSSAHQEWLGRGITQASLPFASQLFENERGRQMAATGQAQSLAGQDFGELGQGLQAAQQGQAAPWEALQRYQGAVGGNYGGTSTGTQPYSNPNTAANVIGLGLAGAGLWNTVGPALLAMSDERLKTDIKKVGQRGDGLGVYTYRYKGTPERQVGVMAQEVLMKKPEAVHDVGGLLAVDYGKLGGLSGMGGMRG